MRSSGSTRAFQIGQELLVVFFANVWTFYWSVVNEIVVLKRADKAPLTTRANGQTTELPFFLLEDTKYTTDSALARLESGSRSNGYFPSNGRLATGRWSVNDDISCRFHCVPKIVEYRQSFICYPTFSLYPTTSASSIDDNTFWNNCSFTDNSTFNHSTLTGIMAPLMIVTESSTTALYELEACRIERFTVPSTANSSTYRNFDLGMFTKGIWWWNQVLRE